VDQRPHEAPISTQTQQPNAVQSIEPLSVDLKSVMARFETSIEANNPSGWLETVRTLTPVLTSQEVLQNPRRSASAELRNALMVWNRATLKLVQAGKGSEVREFIEGLLASVSFGCDTLLRGCQNVAFFRQDPGTAQVLEVYLRSLDAKLGQASPTAEWRAQLVSFYRHLNLAFELRRNVATNELEFMYLNRASQLSAQHREMPAELQAQVDLARHREVMSMILGRFQPDLSTPEARARFATFIDNFSPWEFSRRADSATDSAANQGQTRLLSLAARTSLYAANGTQLSDSLKKAIESSQRARTAVEGEESFAQAVDVLKRQNSRIWSNLKLADDFPRNEYFFMVDRLFRDHLTVDDVTAIWEGSRQDGSQLLSIAEKYIKIEIGRMVVRTNSFMSSVYESNKSHQSIFKDTIEKSYPLSTQWDQMLKRVERIGTLVSRIQKQVPPAEFQKFERNLNAVRRNIKFVSVYPNMMLMAYFLEEAQFKLEIFTFFGVIKLDTADIINAFFDGRLTPWFSFGNDGEGLRRLETLFAFYFALKTDSFHAFSAGSRPIDEVLFFEKVIGRYLAENEKLLLQHLSSIQDNIRNSPQHGLLQQICRQDRLALEAGEKVGGRGLGPTLNLNQFETRTYLAGGHLSPMQGLSSFYSSTTLDAVQKVRQDLDRKLRFVETMVRVLSSHLGANGAEKIEKIRANLQRVVGLRRQLLAEIWNRNRELSTCLTQSLLIEWDRQRQLIDFEARHLRAVHAELTRIRNATATQREALETEANLRIRREFPLSLAGDRLPSGFLGQGGFQEGQYQISKLDLLLRLRAAMRSIAPNTLIQLPPDLADTDLWRQPQFVSLNAEMGVEEFVRAGLKVFHTTNSGYISWISNTRLSDTLQSRLRLAVELYQLGRFEVGSDREAQTVSFSADSVVEVLMSTLQSMSIGHSPDEARVLDLIGSASRFERAEYDKMLFDAQGRGLSLAEKVYQMVTDDETGLSEARELYTTSRGMGHFLFAPDESVNQTLREQFVPLVQRHFNGIRELEQALERRELSDAQANRLLEVGYEIRGGQVLTVGPVRTPGDRARYLSPSRIRDAEARRGVFDSATNGFFGRGQD
jgi:hypothetical protein